MAQWHRSNSKWHLVSRPGMKQFCKWTGNGKSQLPENWNWSPQQQKYTHPAPRKLTWLVGKSTIWRCISYWKWRFCNFMLVFRGVYSPLNTKTTKHQPQKVIKWPVFFERSETWKPHPIPNTSELGGHVATQVQQWIHTSLKSTNGKLVVWGSGGLGF